MELRVEDLRRQFGDVRAVDGVTFTVRSGEVVGLLGPNGAGKTTTLRMIAGILNPSSGRVLLQPDPGEPGQGGPSQPLDVHQQPLDAKARMGFLSGDTQLYQRLTPREVLRYFGELYQVPEPRLSERVEALIAQLEMEDFSERPCDTLSSGQKQRANIARAFLHEPELLILDEPTSALDVISGQFIVDTIRGQRAAGRAVLFSTHIMSEAEYLCDRIVLLHAGRVVDQGPLPELLERAETENLTDIFLRHHAQERGAPST